MTIGRLPGSHQDDPDDRRAAATALLTAVLLLPASAWYLILLVAPLAIVIVFSFGERGADGGLRRRVHHRELRDDPAQP